MNLGEQPTGKVNMKPGRKCRAESDAKVLARAIGRLGLSLTVIRKTMSGNWAGAAQLHDLKNLV